MKKVIELGIIQELKVSCDLISMLKLFSDALAFNGLIFTFLPEKLFTLFHNSYFQSEIKLIIVNRILFFLISLILIFVIKLIILMIRRKILIRGRNYCIIIKYGNILKQKNCRKIIPFDECFTTNIGEKPIDIKKSSICGQFLIQQRTEKIKQFLEQELKQTPFENSAKTSLYNNKQSYQTGTLLLYETDYLLLAFSKLNKDGLAELTREQYLSTLDKLWSEIDKYYGQRNICIPILGSGITRINDANLTQQELLNLMILSYRLSKHKIKTPSKLIIICQKKDDFSINRVFRM